MLFKALISMNFVLFGKMKKWNAIVPNIPIFQDNYALSRRTKIF